MIEFEVPTEQDFSTSWKVHPAFQQFHYTRVNSTLEEIKKLLMESNNDLHNPSECKTKQEKCEIHNNERIQDKLTAVSNGLLSRSPTVYEYNSPFARELRGLESSYMKVMEKFLQQMEKFLLSNKKLHEELLKSLKEFQVVNRSTAQFTLASSITNAALLIGSLVHRIFHFPFNPKISILTFIVGSMSAAVPLVALSYMKRTTNEISRNVRKRNRFLMDLTVAHRRGNWIDLKVPGLFPHGIGLNSDDKLSSKEIANFEDRHTWRIDLCSSIILTNIQKDITLLKDENFLSKVKMFVESPVSENWWNRIKLKKLIEEVRKKTDNLPAEKFMAGHENFVCRTAQYLYPVIIPWMVSPLNSEHMRYLCGSISGLLAGLDLGNDYNEEFEDLKKLSQTFKKDLKEITKLCEMMNDGDD